MKLFTAHLATETNTFSPMPTGWQAFEEYGIGRAGSPSASEAQPIGDEWRKLAHEHGDELVESVSAYAQPAGRTLRAVYESLRDEIVGDLRRAGNVDAILLNLHGAMVADGYDDCEGDLIGRLRAVVGPGVAIGAVLDLHCHLTQSMVGSGAMLVAYKEYPHSDMVARAGDVFRLCRDAAEGRVHPVTESFDCRMIGVWPTTREPMRSFVERLHAAESEPGVLSVSLGHGFPWGDVADVGARVWAICDGDRRLARDTAEGLGRRFLTIRSEASPAFLSVADAVARARSATQGPIVLADVADNPGGGAPGDSTFLLRALLDAGVHDAACGTFWDPMAVAICFEAGAGARLDLRVGGKCGPSSGPPLDLSVTVRALAENHSQTGLGAPSSLGRSAWVHVDGIDLVLASRRSQVFSPDAFGGLGIDPRARRVVAVKSTHHFYAGFAPLAREIHHVATPGALTPDFANIPYSKRSLEYWPRVADPFAG